MSEKGEVCDVCGTPLKKGEEILCKDCELDQFEDPSELEGNPEDGMGDIKV